VDIQRYGARALLVTPRGVAPLIHHPAVVEVIPGAETVLVVVSDSDAVESVRRSVEAVDGEVVGAGSSDGLDREVVLDVVYDGEDLIDVATAAGLSADDVTAIHSSAVYRCDFCGFAPGFGYLSGLDARLHLPRRMTPRQSVPAGSVAIAGPYSAAYPSPTPGGWHLLGHTDTTLWNLDADPPALITPGTAVRFRPTDGSGRRPSQTPGTITPELSVGNEDAQTGGRAVLRVVAAGVATSLQDQGRPGYAHLAVPGSGAVDRRLADLVNRLVGNPPHVAVLETAGRLVLESLAPAVVADSTSGAVQAITPGDTLRVVPAEHELWAYLAVRGGFAAEAVLGSRSWDSLSKLGPRPLHRGDTLAAGHDPGQPLVIDLAPHLVAGQATVIAVREGPRADWFGAGVLDQLTGTEWTVATTSRVGARLSGPQIARQHTGELPTEGLVTGAIQIPPDGQPVVMFADHPTTGGYPVAAVVEEGDIGLLAQRPPGSPVRFRPIERMAR
jgi:KipI family sensor histidine kinase inhibitor